MLKNSNGWLHSAADVFWAEIAPAEHVIQIYQDQHVFLDTLAGFVGGGINTGECTIVIATESHLASLMQRLRNLGISVDTLKNDDRFIPVIADEMLSKFMAGGWPDELLFNKAMLKLVKKANNRGRRIRAFGEMVALLWAQGNASATVNLEYLWNKFCRSQSCSLFCAYPKSDFTNDLNVSLDHICSCHSKTIEGSIPSLTHVLYKNTNYCS